MTRHDAIANATLPRQEPERVATQPLRQPERVAGQSLREPARIATPPSRRQALSRLAWLGCAPWLSGARAETPAAPSHHPVGPSPTSSTRPADASPALAMRLADAMRDLACPGALVALDIAGAAPLRLALGRADAGRDAPMAFDLHLRIGSVAKLFVGAAALRLVDQGRLALDTRLAPGRDDAAGRITVDMLGRHTAGLSNPVEDRRFRAAVAAAPARHWSAAELLSRSLDRAPVAPPGAGFGYSNNHSVALALLIEGAAGRPYADALAELVIAPLGLIATAPTPPAGLPPPHPRGYRHGRAADPLGYGDQWFDATAWSASWAGPGGDMHATLDDLARAIKPLATGALLTGAGRAALARWTPTGRPGLDYGFHIGRRAARWRDAGAQVLGHSGDVPGFSASAVHVPEADLSAVVLTNLSNSARGRTPAVELERIVLEHAGVTS